MKNKNTIISVVVIIFVISLFFGNNLGLFATFNGIDIHNSCAQATEEYTFGAQEGECFQYCVSNACQIMKVNQVLSRSDDFCEIRWQQADSCSNNQIHLMSGLGIFCTSDNDCNGNRCVNRMCTSTPSSNSCSNPGTYSCLDTTHRQLCLANGVLSGGLPCPQGMSCSNGNCIGQSQPCTTGATQACTASNSCTGSQTCSNGVWSSCSTSLIKCSDGTCQTACQSTNNQNQTGTNTGEIGNIFNMFGSNIWYVILIAIALIIIVRLGK